MKKLIFAAAFVGVLVLGAFAAVTIGSSGTAVAQSDTPQTEAPSTTNTAVPDWVDQVLNGLVAGGILTDDSADQLRAQTPFLLSMLEEMNSTSDTDADDPDAQGHLPFDIERFKDQLDGFELPEGLDDFGFFGQDGFDLEGLLGQFENFDFGTFELPEGFDHPEGLNPESLSEFRFPGSGFGFLDGITGLSFSDLRDAMQNGTLSDLIDPEDVVSGVSDQLDAAVTEGDITPERADEILRKLTEKLDAIANGELPFFDHGQDGGFGSKFLHPQTGSDA